MGNKQDTAESKHESENFLKRSRVAKKIAQFHRRPNVCHWPVCEPPPPGSGVKEENGGPALLLRSGATHHTLLESSPEVIDASSDYDA